MKTCPPLFRSSLHLKSGWVNVYPPKHGETDYEPGIAFPDRSKAAGSRLISVLPTETRRPLYRIKVTLHAG